MVSCLARVFRPLAVVATLTAMAGELTAQAGRALSTRVSLTVTGDLATAGNTLLTCAARVSCAAAQSGAAAGSLNDNDSHPMRYVDVDGDPTTFNSSLASLTLPPGATVRWAGLYWGGRSRVGSGGSAAPDPSRAPELLFGGPGTGYATVTAAQFDRFSENFAGFADVTALVRAGGPGAYRVANLQAATGRGGFGGWSLLVAYDVAGGGSATRFVQVQDGLQVIAFSASAQATFTGLVIPQTGPVASDVTMVLYDGDRARSGDQIRLNGQPLSDPLNPAGSQLNSSIGSLGVRFSQKSPDFDNQLGIDLDRIDATGVLAPGATTATVGVRSTDESFLHVLALTVPQDLGADLEVTKTGPASVPALGSIIYSITARNRGPGLATDVVIEDTLPAGVVFVSATGGGAVNGRVVAWPAIPSLASGAQQSFSVTVRAPAAGSLTNVVAGRTTSPDSDPTNNDGSSPSARVVTVVDPRADVAVTKTGPATITGIGQVSYTVTVANLGPSTATDVVVTDSLPAGATFVSATLGGAVDPAGTIVTWPTIPTMASGAVQTFALTILSPPGPSFTNVAAATSLTPDPDLSNNNGSAATSRVTTVVTSSADVEVTKSGPATVQAGDTIDYVVLVRNLGPDPASDVVVTDTLPAGATFLSASHGGTETGGVVSWPVIPTLAVGASQSFTVSVRAPSGGPATLVNVAAGASSTPDPDLSNNNGSSTTGRVTTVVGTLADVVTTKSGPAVVAPNGTVVYTITVRNDGPNDAANVILTDTVPAAVTLVSATGGAVLSGSILTWPVIALLPVGASQRFDVTVTAPATGTFTNVAASTATTSDPDPGNNDGSASDGRVTTTVADRADVEATKTAPAVVDPLGSLAYTITLTNFGPSPAVHVVLTDTLPAQVSFVSATGGAVLDGRVLTWPTVPILAVNDTLTFTVTVTAPVSGSFTNVVAATSATSDPDPGNNDGSSPRARPTTQVRPLDVAVAKTHVGDFVVGTLASYQLVVTNVGAVSTVGPLTVVDTLPASLAIESASGPGWSCNVSGQVVTCAYPALLAPAASAGLEITVRVLASAVPQVTNRAIVSTPGDEEPTGNNVAEDTVAVSPLPPLVIEKRALRTEVEVGDVVDYQLLVSNVASVAVSDVEVLDTLPLGFRYRSGTARLDGTPLPDPAGAPGPVLRSSIGDLPPNSTVTLSYRLVVGAGATAGDGVNKAFARSIPAGIESPVATARVRFRGGLLDDRAFIVGRVAARYDSAGRRRDLGVPGVRVILTDGTSAVTDEEGKYSFYGLAPILYVVRVDETTLPDGLRISVTNARQLGNSLSQLADLKNGELHRADFFATDSLTPALRAAVAERRALGAIYEAIPDSARASVPADRSVSGEPGAAGISRDRADSTAIRGAYQSVTGSLSAPIAERSGLARVSLAGSAPPPPANGDRIMVSVPAGTVPADGHALVAVRVQVVRPGAPATDGVPVTLESSLGRWQVDDRDPAEPGVQTMLARGEATFGLIASAVEGVGEVRVTAGSLAQTATVVFVPALRPMVAAGLLQGRIDFRSLSKGALVSAVPSDGFEQELRDLATTSDDGLDRAAGRGALFLKGKVQGKYLLTVAYDSERDPQRQLFRDIRPEEFYPVYGDASVREYGAQSYERLYVRVDRDRSFFLYGDFATPAPSESRELGAYLRTLTGAVQRIEHERVQLSAFASRSENRQVVDEIRGRGVSGPYELSRGDGLVNSERIELLTRDRNQPARILRLEPMRRFVDYTIEPLSGRILFRRPVPSVDADLNPVSIRVSYELERDGGSEWVYGGDAQLRLSRRLELGAAAVHEDDPLDSFDLLSLNGALRITPHTVVQAEWARTDGSARDAGDAGRIELRHQGGRLDAHLFGAQSDSSFSNSSSSFGGGRRELGASFGYRLDERTRLLGHALSTQDRRADGRRDGALLAVERRLGRDVRAEVGYRYGHETAAPADGLAQAPNETNALHTRISVDFGDSLSSGLRRGAVFGEYDQDLEHGDQRRGAFGAHYQLLPRLRLYGRHEFLSSFAGPFALNGDQRTQATVIGFDGGYAEDGQVFSEYRLRDGLSGRDGEAVMGLRNRWTVARGLRLDASFERIHPTTGGSTVGEATAVAGGIEYSSSPDWRGTARLEVRDAASGTTLLATAGYARKLSDDWTTLGRIFWNDLEQDQVRTRGQLGLAWRQTSESRVNGLARLDRRFERLGVAGAGQATHGATVLSAHLNWQATDHLVLSGRWASKWASDSSAGLESATTAHLAMVRGIQDIGRSWDLGVQASTLSVVDAGRRFGLGVELGRRIIDDLRLAVGYNLFGLRDRDIPDTEYTLRGAYVRFDIKFDERLFGRDR